MLRAIVSFSIVLNLFIFFFMTSSSEVESVEVALNYNYRVENGSIETSSGDIIKPGEYIKVLRNHNSWALAIQRLDDNFQPVGPELIASRRWTEAAVVDVSIDDAVRIAMNADVEVAETVEPPVDCTPKDAIAMAIQEAMNDTQATSPQAPETSIRPVLRPPNLASAPISSYLLKSPDEVVQYLSCHKYNEATFLDYGSRYKNSIARMSRAYSQQSGGSLNQNDVTTMMSCLLFRESWGWRGISSESGAVGLGQFTGVAISDVKKFIAHDIVDLARYDRRDQIQRDEHAAGRLSSSGLRSALAAIDAERRKSRRFNELRRLWDSIPMSNRPSSGQVTRNYLANNNNHEAVIALSSLLVKNCQIRFEQQGFEMDAMTSLLACSGGYNMGPGGFKDEALGRKGGPQNLNVWLSNLKNSGHRQRRETHNHLVSIHRCMSDGENFPQCGTRPDHCQALPMADQCPYQADPQCWMLNRQECPWPKL